MQGCGMAIVHMLKTLLMCYLSPFLFCGFASGPSFSGFHIKIGLLNETYKNLTGLFFFLVLVFGF